MSLAATAEAAGVQLPGGPVRMAMIGCGAIAELGHLPAAPLAPEVQFTVLIDRDEKRARTLAERFGIAHVATDMAAAAEHAEAACVALPHHIHREATETLCGLGLHVLIEKPLATNAADCAAMVAAAERADRVLAVAMVRRFAPSSLLTKQIVESGMLGRIESFRIVSGVGESWPAHSLYMLRAKESGGGVLISNGCHDLDMLTWLLGEVTEFDCRIDSRFGLEGNCTIECTMSSGARGVVELSRTRTLNNIIYLEGERGIVEAPLMGGTLKITPKDATAGIAGQIGDEPFSFDQAMAGQLTDFALAVRGVRPPLVSGREGAAIVSLIERFYGGAQQMDLPWMLPVVVPEAA